MSTSTTDSRSPKSRTETALSRYDLVLLVIPVAFLAGLLATRFLSVPLPTAMAAASTVGVLAVADGLFVNPPRPS